MDISLTTDFSSISRLTRIFLWGMPGVGKSTLGKRLASKLEWSFIDLDQLIEESQKHSIPEIFQNENENGFREIERSCLHETMQSNFTVISCGGGTPCFHDNADWMNKNGLTIYLDAQAGFLASRISQSKDQRPLIKNKQDALDELAEMLNKRERFYNQAKVIVQIPGQNIDQIVQLISPFIQGKSEAHR